MSEWITDRKPTASDACRSGCVMVTTGDGESVVFVSYGCVKEGQAWQPRPEPYQPPGQLPRHFRVFDEANESREGWCLAYYTHFEILWDDETEQMGVMDLSDVGISKKYKSDGSTWKKSNSGPPEPDTSLAASIERVEKFQALATVNNDGGLGDALESVLEAARQVADLRSNLKALEEEGDSYDLIDYRNGFDMLRKQMGLPKDATFARMRTVCHEALEHSCKHDRDADQLRIQCNELQEKARKWDEATGYWLWESDSGKRFVLWLAGVSPDGERVWIEEEGSYGDEGQWCGSPVMPLPNHNGFMLPHSAEIEEAKAKHDTPDPGPHHDLCDIADAEQSWDGSEWVDPHGELAWHRRGKASVPDSERRYWWFDRNDNMHAFCSSLRKDAFTGRPPDAVSYFDTDPTPSEVEQLRRERDELRKRCEEVASILHAWTKYKVDQSEPVVYVSKGNLIYAAQKLRGTHES